MFKGFSASSEAIRDAANSEAEQAGAAIGTGLGMMMLIFIWVAGDVVFGLITLLTRPKR